MARSVSYPSNAVVVFDDFDGEDYEFDDYVDDIRSRLREAFPSMNEVDKWVGREDRAIMANGFAYAGISAYGGLIAIWIVARDDIYGSEVYLAENWVAGIEPRFEREFGSMVKVGSMSNGEGVYRAKEGLPAIPDSLDDRVVINGMLCA